MPPRKCLWTFIVGYAFLAFFVIGVLVHRDYGVSTDEPALLKYGSDAFAYLFFAGPVPAPDPWQFHTPLVQVFMTVATKMLSYTDGADIWFLRHLITFCIFFIGIAAFTLIARRRFHDWKLPLLGAAMFMLSPRLFAHGFYNPKDIPTLTAFTVSVLTLLRLTEKQAPLRLALHVLSSAIVISLRVFGLLMPVFTVVALLARKPRPSWKHALMYSLALPPVLILLWPLLWTDPIGHFLGAMFSSLSRPAGQLSAAAATDGGVSWLYVPVWIFVTTPVMYSLLFFGGCLSLLMQPRRHLVTLLAAAWFFIPVIALPLFRLGIFNEWRHVLFLYPAFLLIALEGASRLWIMNTNPIWRRFLGLAIGLQMVLTGFWILKNHPFEYVYFSVPTGVVRNFDRDYWGLSYRAGLEWILGNDRRKTIRVYPTGRIARAAADTLPLSEWNRLKFSDPATSDYVLVNVRGDGQSAPPLEKLHTIVVDDLEILAVYRGPDVSGTFKAHEW